MYGTLKPNITNLFFPRFDCGYAGDRADIKRHESECDSAELICPFFQCYESYTHDKMEAHIEEHTHGMYGELFERVTDEISFMVRMRPPTYNTQKCMIKMLTNKKGSVEALMFFDYSSRHGQFLVWAYHMGKPSERKKHKIKINMDAADLRDVPFSYVGGLYGGGDATMDFKDKIGLRLPEEIVVSQAVRVTQKNYWDLHVSFELL